MIVTCVQVSVKPECVEPFIRATTDNHLHSVQEPGNLRFDVLQCEEDETCFTLYEAYASEADAKAHKNTDHYRRWQTAVEPFMASPRVGIRHRVIEPANGAAW